MKARGQIPVEDWLKSGRMVEDDNALCSITKRQLIIIVKKNMWKLYFGIQKSIYLCIFFFVFCFLSLLMVQIYICVDYEPAWPR